MIQETDILGIVDDIIDLRNKKKNEIPEYFRGYRDYVSWKNAITNHTVKGKKAVDLISVKAPNQSDEELQYVLDNYKQITLPVSYEYISTIGRGLHDGNWSIDYPEEKPQYVNADMGFKKYIEEDIAQTPLRMSFDSWIKFVLPTIKLNDSMGVVGFKPYRQDPTVFNEEGEEVIAGDTLPEPIPYYYGSERVLSNMDWGYLLIETNSYSVVQKGNKSVREGLIFELWDDANIWVIEQVGKQSDWTFEYYLYVNHNLGYIPATYLMGSPVYNEDGSLCYQSPFLMVTDILDEVLLDGCNLRSIKASCVYPQKVMLGNECQFQDEHNNVCRGGYILKHDGSGYYKCAECHGTGMVQRTGVLNTLYVKGKTMNDEGDQIKPTDALTFVSPSVDIPVYLRDEIEKGIAKSLSILHLKTTNSAVKGAEDMTATGMVMDEKGKYAFIKSVVDQIFDIYDFGNKCIGELRYGPDFELPTINKPISYDFNTEGDYLMQIGILQEAGAPPAIIASYVYKYLKAIFYDNPTTAKAFDLVIAADRLFTLSKAQIDTEIQRNLVERWQVVLHDSALTFIQELVREDENFLYQEMDVMITALKEKAIAQTPAVTTGTRLSPETILGNANA